MKKKNLLSLALVVTMVASLTGCNSGSSNSATTAPSTTQAATTQAATEATTEATTAAQTSDVTIASALVQVYKDNMTADANLMDVMNAIAKDTANPYHPEVFEISEGYLNGFTEEVKGFNSGVGMAPMIGTIPFIGYIFDVDNPEEFISSVEKNIDLRWNICTTADEYMIETVGNRVFIIMAPFNAEN